MCKIENNPDITRAFHRIEMHRDRTVVTVFVVETTVPLSSLSQDFDEERFQQLMDFLQERLEDNNIDRVEVIPASR